MCVQHAGTGNCRKGCNTAWHTWYPNTPLKSLSFSPAGYQWPAQQQQSPFQPSRLFLDASKGISAFSEPSALHTCQTLQLLCIGNKKLMQHTFHHININININKLFNRHHSFCAPRNINVLSAASGQADKRNGIVSGGRTCLAAKQRPHDAPADNGAHHHAVVDPVRADHACARIQWHTHEHTPAFARRITSHPTCLLSLDLTCTSGAESAHVLRDSVQNILMLTAVLVPLQCSGPLCTCQKLATQAHQRQCRSASCQSSR